MRNVFIAFFFFGTLSAFAQGRPLTSSERKWLDSLNTLYGAPNDWFDSLMQREGKCVEAIRTDEGFPESGNHTVLHFYRELHPGVMVYDAPSIVFFDYYLAEKKIIAPEMEMYLRPQGPLIVEFRLGRWGMYTSGMLLRTSKDTLYRNDYRNRNDTVLTGFADTSKYAILAGKQTTDPLIAAVKILDKGTAINDREGNPCRLYACTYVSAHYPALAETYPVFRDTFYVLSPDSLSLKQGTVVLGEWKSQWTRDEKRMIDFQYFRLVRRFSFSPAELERVIVLRDNEYVQAYILPTRNRKENREYRKFVKGDVAANDPSGIYLDPVLRWLYRKKKFTPSPSR